MLPDSKPYSEHIPIESRKARKEISDSYVSLINIEAIYMKRQSFDL